MQHETILELTKMVKAVEAHDLWAEVEWLADQPFRTGVAFPLSGCAVSVRNRQVEQSQSSAAENMGR